jgi:DNA-binding beta-propeller fold protein YncE
VKVPSRLTAVAAALVAGIPFVQSSTAGSGGALAQLEGPAGCLTSDVLAGCGRTAGIDGSDVIALSPDGRSVYVAGTASLAIFSRNIETGALTQLAGKVGCLQDPAPTWHAGRHCTSLRGFWPAAVVVAPDGRAAYVASAVDDRAHGGPVASRLFVFRRDAATGALREQGSTAKARGFAFPGSIAISPDGRNLYAGSDAGLAVFSRTGDGGLSQLRGRAGCLLAKAQSCSPGPAGPRLAAAVAISPDGKNAYVLAVSNVGAPNLLLAFRRDPRTGALSAASAGCLSASGQAGCPAARGLAGLPWELRVALSPDGRSLYVASGSGLATFARRAGGRLDQLAFTRGVGAPAAVSPDGRNAYAASPRGVAAFVRDPRTGRLSRLPCCSRIRSLPGVSGLALTPDGRNAIAVGLTGDYPSTARIAVFRRAAP